MARRQFIPSEKVVLQDKRDMQNWEEKGKCSSLPRVYLTHCTGTNSGDDVLKPWYWKGFMDIVTPIIQLAQE